MLFSLDLITYTPALLFSSLSLSLSLSVLAEDAIKAALKDYKLKQEKLRDPNNSAEAVAQ